MKPISTDLSVPALVHAIKANWADYYTFLGRSSKAELSVGPYLSWFLSGVPDSFLNVVFRTHLPLYGGDAIIDETLAHFRSQKVAQLSWWADAETPRTELDRVLPSRGLTLHQGGTGMAADLSSLHDRLPPIPGLTIIPVDNDAALKQWGHVCSIAFGISEPGETRWFDLYRELAYEPQVRNYLALLNGQPVATSQVLFSAGVAGIYNVTCLPEARNRGIGAAITLAPLLYARDKGYRISILQASSMGFPVYLRLGFKDYGKLNIYVWSGEKKLPATLQ